VVVRGTSTTAWDVANDPYTLTNSLGRFELVDEKLENTRVAWIGVIEKKLNTFGV
jgi:hypothetical protein